MQEFPLKIDMYQLIVGILLPMAIAAIVQCQYSPRLKALASALCVIVAAGLHLYFMGGWNFADLPGTFLKIGYISGTTYLVFLRPLGVTDWIEQHVNPGKTSACDPPA